MVYSGVVMNTNTSNPEPEELASLEPEIDQELQDALDMPDADYIEHLEKYIEVLAETNRFGHQAIQTFVDLLEFIGDNFGNTLDFPIRVDNDFYEGLFSEKLRVCQESIEEFLESHRETNVVDSEEDTEKDDGEVF